MPLRSCASPLAKNRHLEIDAAEIRIRAEHRLGELIRAQKETVGVGTRGRTSDQHDAYSIAAWLSRADRSGNLVEFLKPNLTPPERPVAQVEGWILGVA